MTQELHCATNLLQRDAYLSFLLPHRGSRQTFVVFDSPRFDVGLFFFPLIKFGDTVEGQLWLLVGNLGQNDIIIIIKTSLFKQVFTEHIDTL